MEKLVYVPHIMMKCVCVRDLDHENLCILQIALKSMKPIELRVGGSVEPPNIDISVVSVC